MVLLLGVAKTTTYVISVIHIFKYDKNEDMPRYSVTLESGLSIKMTLSELDIFVNKKQSLPPTPYDYLTKDSTFNPPPFIQHVSKVVFEHNGDYHKAFIV